MVHHGRGPASLRAPWLSARCDDLGERTAEVFAVTGCQRREETVELLGRFSVESGCCPAAGGGERHAQRTPVTWHGRPPDQAASFSSVHQAGQRSLLHAEALSQLSHSPRAGGQDAQELGLDGSQIVTFGDPRMNVLHQAGEPDKPVGGVETLVRAGVLPVRSAPPPGCHHGGRGSLRALVHETTVHDEYS